LVIEISLFFYLFTT